MLVEKSVIRVKSGVEEAFQQVIEERGVPLLAAVPGVKWVKFGRGVENPSNFIFLIEWDRMESHADFNKSPVHPEFLSLFAPYAEAGAMEHFEIG